MIERCPLNVPGPFYTCGYCMACGAPEAEAPDLLAPLVDDNITTYFVRQPETPDEIERACNAMRVCCVDDLRYGGTDVEIIKRLGNNPKLSDYVLVDGQLTFVGRPKDQLDEAWSINAGKWLRGSVVIAAMLFALLGVYVGGYFWLGKCVVLGAFADIEDACSASRQYDSQWLATIYKPAAMVESWLRGIEVKTESKNVPFATLRPVKT